ncbi:hypothetical protein [Peribacillus loiseleuriae]|uniref:hypothetical protein n=1 Tax=Peribacillus loiseleuriae TaxID=1679170 RepID=UPI003D021D54
MDEFCRDCSAGEAFFIECGSGTQIGNLARKVEELARLPLILARKEAKLAREFEIWLVRHETDEGARLNIGVSASQRSPRIIKRWGLCHPIAKKSGSGSQPRNATSLCQEREVEPCAGMPASVAFPLHARPIQSSFMVLLRQFFKNHP